MHLCTIMQILIIYSTILKEPWHTCICIGLIFDLGLFFDLTLIDLVKGHRVYYVGGFICILLYISRKNSACCSK